MVLASWTYSKEDRKAIRKNRRRRMPAVFRLFDRIRTALSNEVPHVAISPDQLSVGKKTIRFHTPGMQLKSIELTDEEDINMLMIVLEDPQNGKTGKEIRVPVPKGKLREAFYVRDTVRSRFYPND